MAAPPLLTLKDIHLSFGGDPVLQGAELMVLPEETVCLIGRNGSGKSTLLKIAADLIDCEEGERRAAPGALRPVRVAGLHALKDAERGLHAQDVQRGGRAAGSCACSDCGADQRGGRFGNE